MCSGKKFPVVCACAIARVSPRYALQMLNMLEHFDLASMGFNSADYLHAHVEAKKLAFADRAKFYADPEFGGPSEALIQSLISKEYAAERFKLQHLQDTPSKN